MTYQEAINYLKPLSIDLVIVGDEANISGEMLMKNMKQALDMAIEALEKQIPKKPVYDETIRKNGEKVRYHIICPGCYSFSPGIGDEHCVKCGQAIDWSEWDEDK